MGESGLSGCKVEGLNRYKDTPSMMLACAPDGRFMALHTVLTALEQTMRMHQNRGISGMRERGVGLGLLVWVLRLS